MKGAKFVGLKKGKNKSRNQKKKKKKKKRNASIKRMRALFFLIRTINERKEGNLARMPSASEEGASCSIWPESDIQR
ncbi:MAG: hypothetical protein K2Q09_04520, partial [Phycisphaerales bacterium]|nr:hypothetical protein [Phycisphaerales bacterium]